jgi:putative phosphoesterase
MKKFAVLSDIHGNILALEAVAAHIRKRSIDAVINLGDHLSGPLWPKETLQFLLQQNWSHISGNHDRQLVTHNPSAHGPSDKYAYAVLNDSEKEWLSSLKQTITLNENILAFHGTPFTDTEYLLETIENGRTRIASQNEITERLGGTKSSLMLCGHTHVARVIETDDNILIVNPGSVGLPAFEDDSTTYHIVESGSTHARYAILEFNNNKWSVELVFIPYDFQKAADQARKNNRPDWETALRTGFMK